MVCSELEIATIGISRSSARKANPPALGSGLGRIPPVTFRTICSVQMKLGYTIIDVPNVAKSLAFFESAFGFSRRFPHESGDYGELDTGETTLAFASHELGTMNLPSGFSAASVSTQPLGFEVAFVTPDVAEAYIRALSVGATDVKAPESKPWGEIVSYVRYPDGILVEICSPVSG